MLNLRGRTPTANLSEIKTHAKMSGSTVILNNVLVLHAHNDRTDDLVISSCLNEFVRNNEHRVNIFVQFS